MSDTSHRVFISYTAEITTHVAIPAYACATEIPSIGLAEIQIKTDHNQKPESRLSISLIFSSLFVYDRDQITTASRKHVTQFLELVSVCFEEPITSLRENEICLNEAEVIVKTSNSGTTAVHIQEPISVDASLFFCDARELVEEYKPLLTSFVTNNIQKMDPLWREYYAAISCSDPIASYMLLYGILSELFGDSQDRVDNEIEAIDPNIQTFPKPDKVAKKNRSTETVFTKARNQIAHHRNADPDTKRKDIDDNIFRLRRITKQLINRHFNVDTQQCPIFL